MSHIIFIPGLLSDTRIWQGVADGLPAHNSTIIDVNGIISIAQMATDILAQNEGQLTLIGHSMGGIIAVEIYRQAPQRVEKLVLVSTSMQPQMQGEAAARQKMVNIANQDGMQTLAKYMLPNLLHPSQHDSELMADLENMMMQMDVEQNKRQNDALLKRPNGYEVAPHISCPTLLIVGRQDKLCRVAEHEDMASKIKNSELIIIENCGHFAPVEQPQQLHLALNNWLST